MNCPPLIRAVFAVLLTGALGGGAAWAHDVKDPVCRMSTDTDTTPYREMVNGKTFYFCSEACKSKFDKSPATYVTLNAALAHGAHRTYRLVLNAQSHPAAGRPAPLVFAIYESPPGRIVHDFEIIHEKRLHFLMVSSDLAWFEHEHPVLGPDGRFRLLWTFPHAGRYLLFADFTPTDGDNQILRSVLDIGGAHLQRHLLTLPHLSPDAGVTKTVGETRIRLTVRPGPLRAGKQALLTYTLTDLAGHPRTDMQLILGVMSHLVALREDGKTIVHTHALHGVQPGSYGAVMLAMRQAGQPEAVPVTPDMVTPAGPAFSFKLTLPKPGRYRLWAQFQRQNQWLTVPFTVEVQ